MGGKLAVMGDVGEYLGTGPKSGFVRYRINKPAAQEEVWGSGSEGRLVFAHSPAPLARQLMGWGNIVLEASNFNGTWFRVTYTLRGSRKAITPVVQACSESITGD